MSTLEFDTAYSARTGARVPGQYIPTVEHDDVHDVLIDGGPTRAHSNGDFDVNSGWDVLSGYTRQHGYRGAVMHLSETVEDDTVREWVRDAGGDVFAIVAVEAPCDPCDPCYPDTPDHCVLYGCDAAPAGWTIIYREEGN